jgi:cysteine desulfurase
MVSMGIYLDNHSTTRLDPRVLDAMLPWLTDRYGNAGSTTHEMGREAREAVEHARAQVAEAIGARVDEIVFTSGATEAINLAILGSAARPGRESGHVVSLATEHRATLDPLAHLARHGRAVTLLEVAPQPRGDARDDRPCGGVTADEVAGAIRPDTFLVSALLANNEIGTIQPVRAVADVATARGCVVHLDASQALGRVAVDVDGLGCDLASFSAHKFHGPKGAGFLFVRRRDRPCRIEPLVHGGGQERGLRSGTLDVPAIVGMGAAAGIAARDVAAEMPRIALLRDRLWRLLSESIAGITVNGPSLDEPTVRLGNNLNVRIERVDGQSLLATLSAAGIAASSGSACSSAEPAPSHVLRAIGLSDDEARSSLRFGLSRFTTEQEVDIAAATIAEGVAHLRGM